MMEYRIEAEATTIKAAFLKGLLPGITAYGTLALPNGWSIANYPTVLVLEVIMEGVLFAPIASVVTTWWLIRRENALIKE